MDNIEVYDPSDELVHWGIKGMRWGVRRYQNKDGSLTDAGKKRLKAETDKVREEERVLKNRKATQAKIDKLEARKKAAADEKKALDDAEAAKSGKGKKRGGSTKDGDAGAEKKTKKSVDEMTDEELFNAVNRARMEDAYRQLRPEQEAKPKFGAQMLNDVIKPAATNAGKKFVENALTKIGENILKDKVDPNSLEALTKMRDKVKAQLDTQTYKNALERAKNDPDGDLKWGDRKIKQQWEATEQAKKEKAAAEQAKKEKAAADEAARKANEARSQAEYERANSTYSSGGRRGERTTINPDTSTSSNSSTASRAQSFLSGYSGWNQSYSALPSSTNTSRGREVATSVVDKYGNTIADFDSDGNVIRD